MVLVLAFYKIYILKASIHIFPYAFLSKNVYFIKLIEEKKKIIELDIIQIFIYSIRIQFINAITNYAILIQFLKSIHYK